MLSAEYIGIYQLIIVEKQLIQPGCMYAVWKLP